MEGAIIKRWAVAHYCTSDAPLWAVPTTTTKWNFCIHFRGLTADQGLRQVPSCCASEDCCFIVTSEVHHPHQLATIAVTAADSLGSAIARGATGATGLCWHRFADADSIGPSTGLVARN